MATLLDIVKKGSTNRSVTIRIIDSTDGTPETAVEHNTAGIDLWYRREGEAKASITEAALAALTTAHTDGGIEHIGDGEYRIDLPDAAFATGAQHVDVGGTVTGMIVIGGRVRLVDYDPEDTVRLGLTALPNAAADAAGGLPISDAGGLDMDAILVDTNALNDTKIPDTLSLANINTQVDTAIETYQLHKLFHTALNDPAVTNNSGFARLVSSAATADISTYDNTTDSMQAVRDHIGDGTNLTEAGGTGDHLTAITDVTSAIVIDTQDIQNRLPSALVNGRMNSNIDAIDDSTGAALRLQRWLDAGRSGTIVSATSTTVTFSGLSSNDQHYRGWMLIFNETDQYRIVTNYVGSTGVATVHEAFVSTPGNGSSFVLLPLGTMNVGVWSNTAVGALNDVSASDVNAQVVDALATDTYAEPSGVPAATSSLKDKINWMFTLARNRLTQTATQQTLRNDANSGNIGTANVSDDGTTHTREEWT